MVLLKLKLLIGPGKDKNYFWRGYYRPPIGNHPKRKFSFPDKEIVVISLVKSIKKVLKVIKI